MAQTVIDIYFVYAVLLAALGTYLIRAVPFLLSMRKEKRSNNHPQINLFFQLMGPSMIAALLVTSTGLPNYELLYRICRSGSKPLAVEKSWNMCTCRCTKFFCIAAVFHLIIKGRLFLKLLNLICSIWIIKT